MTKPIEDSGEQLVHDLLTYSNAGAGIIHVRAKEVARAYKMLRDGLVEKGCECNTWNIVTGSHTATVEDIEKTALRAGDNNPDFQAHFINLFHKVDEAPTGSAATSDSIIYHIYVSVDRWFEEPSVEYIIQHLSRDLPTTLHRVIFITGDTPLPDSVSDLMVSVTMTTPTYAECLGITKGILDYLPESYKERMDISNDGIDLISKAGSGLSYEEFETYLSEAIVKSIRDIDGRITHDDILRYLNVSKTYIVNKSDLLELYNPESIENVGGLDNIKNWVAKRKNCYTDEAKAMGIEPPKGILITGVSGTGKSLTAKALASALGFGLVRLDMGKMFNSFVGASEERMRKALKLAEDLAPVVLLCVSGDTVIRLYDGTDMSAENLYELAQTTDEDIQLLGYDPRTGEHVALSMKTMIRSIGKPMLRITDDNGAYIDVTKDHRLLVNRRGERIWVQAKELQEGDDLVTQT